MDFTKLTKLNDPVQVFPELAELTAWGLQLDIYLEFLRRQLKPLPDPPEDLPDDELEEWLAQAKANQEPLYDHIPQPDEVRRYMLYCYAKGSPHAKLSDMEKRRQKSLDMAGANKRDRNLDGWLFFVQLTDELAATMLTQLMRHCQDRIYNRWLSNVMAFENLCIELRSPAAFMAEDKKTAAYERKLKISENLPGLDTRIAEDGTFLFGTDTLAVNAATGAALNEKSDFQGGWAESMATNVG